MGFLIQRNSVSNIFQPNILQTLLNGRKKRQVDLEEEKIYNMVDADGQHLMETIDLLAYDEPTCSHLLTSCLATSAHVSADQMLTRRVSTKFRAVVGEGRNKCKE